MKYTLPPLPYSYNALEPFIDATTMEIHHTKHHQAYINGLNRALEEFPDYASLPLIELFQKISILPEPLKTAIQNHGGGHNNHLLFWQMMTPDLAKRSIPHYFNEILIKTWGSFAAFQELFTDSALKRFGSGWTWLVCSPLSQSIFIASTPNQDSPYMHGLIPLLGVDVWEHAYYLSYQNRRADYIKAWFSVINWQYVSEHYESVIQ